MLFRARRGFRHPWRARESILRYFRGRRPAFLQVLRSKQWFWDLTWPSMRLRLRGHHNLHQPAGALAGIARRTVHHIRIFIFVKQRGPDGIQEAAERSEGIVHSRSFVAAMDHAVRALGISALGAVLVP